MNASKTSSKTLCTCGKRMNKYAKECKTCHVARMDALHAKARAIVSTGKCPDCGSPLRANISLTGWWTCSAGGSKDFRAAGFENAPACLFQTFTE